MKLTIGKKILFGYGFAMLCMAITGISAYQSTQRLREANGWVRHTYLVIDSIGEVRLNLLRIDNACRVYLLTGDEQFHETSDGFRTDLAESRKRLRTLTADNPAQQRRLDALDPAINQGQTDLIQISKMRREKGFSAAVALLEHLYNAARVAEVRSLLSAIRDDEHTLLAKREQVAEQRTHSTNGVILYGNLIVFAFAAFLGIATRLSITRRVGEFQQFVASVEERDLTQKPVREGSDELGQLARGLNQVVARLHSMATQTRSVTEHLNSAAIDILASAKEQSAVTGEQLAAYQETNTTMQDVSQSCLQIAERAKQVTATAAAVSVANISGLDAVQKTNQTVEAIHEQAEAVAQNIVSLSEKTQMVGDILATVNDIAEQSHLLALNAAIEAAAAGEHGRSFAVVAGEIKNLADQSKAATVQVKSILGDIQKEINTSVMLTEEAVKRVDVGKSQADSAASAIRNMAANIDQSVQAFQQIVAGTNQQQMGFENVMQAMKDLSRASAETAASTLETEKAAANLSDLGMRLSAATEGYRL